MLTINQLKQAETKEALKKRNKDFTAIINEILKTDEERKKTKVELESAQASLNRTSSKNGNSDVNSVKSLKEKTNELKKTVNSFDEKIIALLEQIPNAPHTSVPIGTTPDDNVIVKQVGVLPVLENSKLPHWELAKKFELFDMELGVKLTGSGFPVYTGVGAKLQRALIAFFLDRAIQAGYKEYEPPYMVNYATAYATGQIPDKEGQMYETKAEGFFLIPTAEVPVTNIYRDMILSEKELPIKMCAYSACFRREAGSYGAHVRGLNRLHQFSKVEIVRIEHPEKSYNALDEMLAHVETLLQALNLTYRIVKLCGGDMGGGSALTYDFECYSAAQERWLEVSSTSCFETFQSNRMKLRIKEKNGNKILAHTLNGSALALPRIVACLLEQNQNENEIILPKILHNYMGMKSIKINK